MQHRQNRSPKFETEIASHVTPIFYRQKSERDEEANVDQREREGGRAVIWQAEFRETQPVLRRLYRLYRLPWDYSCEQTRLGITAACHDLYRSR